MGIIGSNNTFLGSKTTASIDCSNSTAIGTGASVYGSNKIVIGTSNETVYMSGALNLYTQTITTTTTLTNPVAPMIFVDNGTNVISITLPSAGTGAILYIRRMAGSTGAITLLYPLIYDVNSIVATTSVGLGTGKTLIFRFNSWFGI